MIKMMKKKKKSSENRQETLAFKKKVLAALKIGMSSEYDLPCPQKPYLWRFLFCFLSQSLLEKPRAGEHAYGLTKQSSLIPAEI